MNTFPAFFVFALRDGEHGRLDLLETELRLQRVKLGLGSYKGVPEPAVLVLDDSRSRRFIKDSVFKGWGQESVLHVDANRFARLVYSDGAEDALGPWREVSEQTAITQPGYSRFDGRFFVAG